ncbi:MAG: metallophosphoesterase family protein [Microvirga sp.]
MALSFYRPRPSGGALAQVDRPSAAMASEALVAAAAPRAAFEPIPFALKGPAPYRLDLAAVLGQGPVDAIRAAGRMTFHSCGDTGGIRDPKPQALVARGMERTFADGTDRASFFYHLGDVVYFMGQRSEYFGQFYDAYEHYPAPIFALGGNHDGQTGPGSSRSLDGFEQNFCAPPGTYTPEASDTARMAMIQPYVYWCLDTPLAYFIGLYTNVPEGGEIDADQRAWFRGQMAAAPTDKALILSLHHPIYSFDNFHSGSADMAREVEGAINESRRVPNLILTAHVHNYQRIEKPVATGILPLFVMGNGGYWNLHKLIAAPGHHDPATGSTLVAATANRHGFATFDITRDRIEGRFTVVPETLSDPEENETFDTFSYPATVLKLGTGDTVKLA